MEKIDEKYISNAVDELTRVIGVKEFVNKDRLYSLVHQNKINECILEIARYLGLPIRINLSFISDSYSRSDNSFSSQNLVTTNQHGRGNGGVVAQVSIPSYPPLYGTESMKNMLINIKVSEGSKRVASAFVAVMAHELSHIVLHCLYHKEKDNEYYTDITAMMLGFNDVVSDGRVIVTTDTKHFGNQTQTTTHTTTYGYLDNDQFYFANQKIRLLINKHREEKRNCSKKVKTFKAFIEKNKKMLVRFKSALQYVDAHSPKSMTAIEGGWVVNLHHPEYLTGFDSSIKSAEKILIKSKDFISELDLYNGNTLGALNQLMREIDTSYVDMDKKSIQIANDTRLLKRYLSFFNKIKLSFV